jgi:hypothetical protein
MAVRLSALLAGHPLAPRKIPGTRVDPMAIVHLESNELIGNRTRDLPAYGIVPQSTTLPRAPKLRGKEGKVVPMAAYMVEALC